MTAPAPATWRTEAGVAAVATFWGSIGLVVREIPQPAVVIVAFRVVIAAAGIGGWLLLRGDGRRLGLLAHRRARTLLQGAMLAAHWVLFFAAMQRAPIGTVVLVVYVAPVLVAMAAPVVLDERLTPRAVAALVLAAGGSVLLLGPGAEGVEPIGLAYAVAAAVLMAGLILNARVLSPLYGGLRLTLAQVSVASVVLLPFALTAGGTWPTWSSLGWLAVLGLAHTAVALVIYLGALGRMPAVHAGVLAYLEPASAAFLGWSVLGERLAPTTVAGGALIVVGGLLVVRSPGGHDVVASPEAPGAPAAG